MLLCVCIVGFVFERLDFLVTATFIIRSCNIDMLAFRSHLSPTSFHWELEAMKGSVCSGLSMPQPGFDPMVSWSCV